VVDRRRHRAPGRVGGGEVARQERRRAEAGLLGLVRALADELGPDGVTVNALCPGWVDTAFNDTFWDHQGDRDAALHRLTDAIPLRRQGTPADLSGLLLLLASEASSYLTGQALVIDGGYTAV
jgi:NAD(P)-dependent dehydrogenase (short-subunit alcohol dehydrogenase family)